MSVPHCPRAGGPACAVRQPQEQDHTARTHAGAADLEAVYYKAPAVHPRVDKKVSYEPGGWAGQAQAQVGSTSSTYEKTSIAPRRHAGGRGRTYVPLLREMRCHIAGRAQRTYVRTRMHAGSSLPAGRAAGLARSSACCCCWCWQSAVHRRSQDVPGRALDPSAPRHVVLRRPPAIPHLACVGRATSLSKYTTYYRYTLLI